MSKKQKNICLVTTIYSFFLYILLKGYNKEDIFIFTAWFPKEVSKNVKHIQMPPVAFRDGAKMYSANSPKGLFKNILGYCRYFYGYIKLRILLFIKTFGKDKTIYGHAFTPFSFMFYENENSYIIEDGLMNYRQNICETHKINPIIDKLLHICGIYFLNANEALGSHKNIKKVYLTNEFDHPLIKDKVEVIDIGELWNKLNKNKQEEILNLFNITPNSYSFNDETILILTQKFDDHTMPLNEELKIYKEFIDKFEGYSIIIKPHPRDTKNYEKIFPNIEIIDRNFPIELLDLIGIKPKIICTIMSTAALNFKDSKIYVYEGEIKNEFLNNARNDLLELIEKQNKSELLINKIN